MAKAKQMEIGAVWVKKDRNGNRYLSIEANGPVIIDPLAWSMVAFANDKGDNENAPDFRLYVAERQRQQDQSDFADNERPPQREQRGRGDRFQRDDNDPFSDE